jgi:hypothetical protein
MKYVIDVPDDMIRDGATEALTICIEEQVDGLYDAVEAKL